MKKSLVGLSVVTSGCSSPDRKETKITSYSKKYRSSLSESSKVNCGPAPAATAASNDTPEVRPPKWELETVDSHLPLDLDRFRKKQVVFIGKFRDAATSGNWSKIREDHFDWWQFPIDSGSKTEYNLRSERDISELRSDAVWFFGYRESIKLVAFSFGWDVESCTLSGAECDRWESVNLGNKDVRLYKMIRSAWLFGLEDYFTSLQTYARYIDSNIYKGGGFHYGSIHLADILSMRLPRLPQ